MAKVDIYGGRSPTQIPAYSIRSAAHYLQLPESTVRSWALGRAYPTREGRRSFEPVIQIADPEKKLLSFQNLIELHVLSAIREERVRLSDIRLAVEYLERHFDTKHPLADRQLFTAGKSVLVEQFGRLVDPSREGQIAVRDLVEAYLKRVDRDLHGIPIRLYPSTTGAVHDERRFVSIDPTVQFGRPCIVKTGIPTEVIASRWKAGDSIEFLAEDYGVDEDAIEEALRFELPSNRAA